MSWITSPEIWISLLTLTVLEIVLGIDNIVFISILAGKLPHEQQARARQVGLGLAVVTRVLLLCAIAWMAKLTAPLVHLPAMFAMDNDHPVSGRDLILLSGGLFLLWKGTREIHDRVEGKPEAETAAKAGLTMTSVVAQILLLDIVFSLDSVITAVGMANHLGVMIAAVVLAVGFMLGFSGPISDFIHQPSTVKMLALAFLIMIGVALVAESFHQEIPKGYIYFAMAFSVAVEVLNLRVRNKQNPA